MTLPLKCKNRSTIEGTGFKKNDAKNAHDNDLGSYWAIVLNYAVCWYFRIPNWQEYQHLELAIRINPVPTKTYLLKIN